VIEKDELESANRDRQRVLRTFTQIQYESGRRKSFGHLMKPTDADYLVPCAANKVAYDWMRWEYMFSGSSVQHWNYSSSPNEFMSHNEQQESP
jgi:hypothetical protein